METFILYTKDKCSYCTQAKALLKRKGKKYAEYVIPHDADKETVQQRVREAGSEVEVRTVPQIFHGDKYVGGFTQLQEYLQQ